MLTAYDTPGARIADAAGVDVILVGDSLANNVLGLRRHPAGRRRRSWPTTSARWAGPSTRALVVGDMPWLSYHVSVEDTVRNAATLVRAGAEAVKLEGGRARVPMIEALVAAEIPVMGHLGLTPQSVHAMGGYKVQAKEAAAADALVHDAKAIAAAGCFAIVLEGVPDVVAARVTDEVDVPTIGIGAGAGCDGQVLVFHDLLGLGWARCPSSSAATPTWPRSPWRRSRPGPPTCARGPSRPTPRPTTCPPSRAPGGTDPPVGYHGRWSRTGSPSGTGRPTEPCSAGGRSPVRRVARVQREVSRACGRTRR